MSSPLNRILSNSRKDSGDLGLNVAATNAWLTNYKSPAEDGGGGVNDGGGDPLYDRFRRRNNSLLLSSFPPEMDKSRFEPSSFDDAFLVRPRSTGNYGPIGKGKTGKVWAFRHFLMTGLFFCPKPGPFISIFRQLKVIRGFFWTFSAT